ncbi:MAG: hypothetical protein M1828_005843 [Chrysothrix sp. TS-e1954]|nr:MAG: hypothetical protein M1828_005843 [Chrysothrix sp. TS-e1954]
MTKTLLLLLVALSSQSQVLATESWTISQGHGDLSMTVPTPLSLSPLALRQAPAAANDPPAAPAQQANNAPLPAAGAAADPATDVPPATTTAAAVAANAKPAEPATTTAVPTTTSQPAVVAPVAPGAAPVGAPAPPANPGAAAAGAAPAPSSAPPPGVTIQAPSVTVVNGVPYTQKFSSIPNPGTSPQVGHIGLGTSTSVAGAETTGTGGSYAQSNEGVGHAVGTGIVTSIGLCALVLLVGVRGLVL